MARVKGAMMTRKRRNATLKLAKGYWGSKSKHFKMAKQQVMKSGNYAFKGRKQKKRDLPPSVDRPDQRIRRSLRHELLHLHERCEEGRHRDEPEEPVRDGYPGHRCFRRGCGQGQGCSELRKSDPAEIPAGSFSVLRCRKSVRRGRCPHRPVSDDRWCIIDRGR